LTSIIRAVSDLAFGGIFTGLSLLVPSLEECVLNGVWLGWIGKICGFVFGEGG
jgi:hypothetical protein